MSFVAVAVGTSAVVGAGASIYGANKQDKAIRSAQEQDRLFAEAEAARYAEAQERWSAELAKAREQDRADASAAEQARLGRMQPYMEAGAGALPQYQQNIGQQPTYAGVLSGLQNDPGYQFEMQQGQDAIQGSAAARGLLRSGRTLKDLASYAQGLASQRAGDAYTRDLNAFNNQQNQLMSLVSGGQNAAAGQGIGMPQALGYVSNPGAMPGMSNPSQFTLARGQNAVDAATNLANVGTNTLGNLLFASSLQNPGATPGGAWQYDPLTMSQMPPMSSTVPRNSLGYFNPMGR